MTDNELMTLVRSADPLDSGEAERFSREPGAVALLDRICSSAIETLVAPPHRSSRRAAITLGSAFAVAAGSVGVAVATDLLGGPAPESVRDHLADLDRGIPADLRYDPDLERARAVAADGAAVLYLADLADGGYCIEVTSSGSAPRGASCVPFARLAGLGLDVLAPLPRAGGGALIVAGRANDLRINAIRVTFPDGAEAPVRLERDRAWLLQIPDDQRAAVLARGLVVRGTDRAGRTVVSETLPPFADDDPSGTAHDGEQALVVETISDSRDFARVLGIRGRVNAPGSVALRFDFPDGTHLVVPVSSDGSFLLDFAATRQDDLASAPGQLVLTRDGRVLDSAAVYSVAGWRAQHG